MIEPDASLLDAAMRVVDRVGVTRATVERIAAEGRVSRVTLHRRGITRAALLDGLVSRAAEAYRHCMLPALVSPRSGAERMGMALRALCDAAEPHLAVLGGLFDAHASVFHDVREAGGQVTRLDFTAPLERLLLDGAADGSLQPSGDVAETAEVLFNAVGWTYVHLRRSHGWSAERARERTVDLHLNGLVTH